MDPNSKVVVGYCCGNEVVAAFCESILDLIVYDMALHRRIVDGGGRIARGSGVNVSAARNEIVAEFLEKSTADWLWMLDTDMVFAPDTLERLLEHADPVKAPIVGGLCFGMDEGEIFPTLYDLTGTADDPKWVRYNSFPENAMFQVAGTGAACLLMHRSALEKIRDFEPRPGMRGFNAAFPWFQETEFGGKKMGEDLTFCVRAGWCGLPVHVNTAVGIGHVKPNILTAAAFLAQRAALEATQS